MSALATGGGAVAAGTKEEEEEAAAAVRTQVEAMEAVAGSKEDGERAAAGPRDEARRHVEPAAGAAETAQKEEAAPACVVVGAAAYDPRNWRSRWRGGGAGACARGRLLVVGGGTISGSLRRQMMELARSTRGAAPGVGGGQGGRDREAAPVRVVVVSRAYQRHIRCRLTGSSSVQAWAKAGAVVHDLDWIRGGEPARAAVLAAADLVWLSGGHQKQLMANLMRPEPGLVAAWVDAMRSGARAHFGTTGRDVDTAGGQAASTTGTSTLGGRDEHKVARDEDSPSTTPSSRESPKSPALGSRASPASSSPASPALPSHAPPSATSPPSPSRAPPSATWPPSPSPALASPPSSLASLADLLRAMAPHCIIAGSSAGAAVMGDVLISGVPRPRAFVSGAVDSGQGLALWPRVIVDQHFVPRDRLPRLITAVLDRASCGHMGVGIDEGTAVVAESDAAAPSRMRCRVLGRGPVVLVSAAEAVVTLRRRQRKQGKGKEGVAAGAGDGVGGGGGGRAGAAGAGDGQDGRGRAAGAGGGAVPSPSQQRAEPREHQQQRVAEGSVKIHILCDGDVFHTPCVAEIGEPADAHALRE